MEENQIIQLCNDIKLRLEESTKELDVTVSKLDNDGSSYHINIYVDGKRFSTKMGISVYNKLDKFEVFIPMVGYFPYFLNVTANQIADLFINKKLNERI